MLRRRSPPMITWPTPSTVSRRFFTTCRAYWLSCCVVRSPCSASHITAAAPTSTLSTTGGSASSGSWRSTWLTLACTSENATSMSFDRLKVIATVETLGLERDWMTSMPGTLLTAVSMMFVTLASMTSGLAPGSTVVIEITGNSTRGKRSTPMRW